MSSGRRLIRMRIGTDTLVKEAEFILSPTVLILRKRQQTVTGVHQQEFGLIPKQELIRANDITVRPNENNYIKGCKNEGYNKI